jgi:hypothetical protein
MAGSGLYIIVNDGDTSGVLLVLPGPPPRVFTEAALSTSNKDKPVLFFLQEEKMLRTVKQYCLVLKLSMGPFF